MEAGAHTVQGGIGNLPQQPMPEAHRLEREYIWGPGDSFAGVDELFVLFDREREPWLVLQDASGDVAALCGRTSISQPAYVAAQWTWDAYGNVFSADHLFDHPFLSVGHKGLFVERLDVGVADASVPGSQYADTPRLTPFAHHIYHNRNRSYHPTLGRFMQADPNASGAVVHGHVMMHGVQPHAGVSRLGLEERHRDGANLYQYLGSAPYEASDPLGLYMWGDNLDTMVVGVSAFTLLAQLSETHLFVQNELIDWATDMSRGDDEIHDINAIGYAASSNGDAQVDALAGPYAQHIQATRGGGLGRMAAGAARRGGGLSARLQVPFNQWLNKGPRNVEVYVRKNSKTGAYEYVGITNDRDRRQREHGAELKKVADNLTRNEARVLEQLLMDTNPHFMSAGSNQNASISSRNPQFNMARQWAQAYVQQHGTRTRWR